MIDTNLQNGIFSEKDVNKVMKKNTLEEQTEAFRRIIDKMAHPGDCLCPEQCMPKIVALVPDVVENTLLSTDKDEIVNNKGE